MNATLRDMGTQDGKTHVTDARGVAVVPADISLVISAPGYVSLGYVQAPVHGTAEFYLLPASTIAGRVVDLRGQPVHGAVVTLDLNRSEAVTTAADGRFQLGGFGPGRRLLTVRGAGVLADRLVAVGLAEAHSLEIKAEKTSTVAARTIVKDTAAPCTGGAVTLYAGREVPSDGCPVCSGNEPAIHVPIAADGGVRVELARGLTYRVEVACHGTMVGEADPFFVGDADLSGLVWAAPRGLQVRGKVIDEAGRLQPGIELFLRSADDQLHEDNGERSTVTDAKGHFEFAGIGSGEYEVELYTELYSGKAGDLYHSGEGSLSVEHSDLEDLVFVVHGKLNERDDDDDGNSGKQAVAPVNEPVRVRGVVRDVRGKPVVGAFIVVAKHFAAHDALKQLMRAWDGHAPIRSDANGAFDVTLPGFHPDNDIEEEDEGGKGGGPEQRTLLAFAPGGALGRASIDVRGDPPVKSVEIRVDATASFTGRVRDRRGRPYSHIGIDLGRDRPRWTYLHTPGGQFTVPGLLPGLHFLRLNTPDGQTGGQIQAVTGRPSPPRTFEPRGAVDFLMIAFTDIRGDVSPIGCKVTLTPVAGPRLTAIIENHGFGEFHDVPAGPARIDFLPCSVGGRRFLAQTQQVRVHPVHSNLFMSVVSHDAARSGPTGDLGFTLAPQRTNVEPIQQSLQVKSLRRGSPAERSGLAIGDVITQVDGHNVSGREVYLEPGTPLKLGLADGRTIELTAE